MRFIAQRSNREKRFILAPSWSRSERLTRHAGIDVVDSCKGMRERAVSPKTHESLATHRQQPGCPARVVATLRHSCDKCGMSPELTLFMDENSDDRWLQLLALLHPSPPPPVGAKCKGPSLCTTGRWDSGLIQSRPPSHTSHLTTNQD
eukprot:scaffold965_cov93-Cylindrotheca_fusiformis.AAC.7